MPDFKNITSNWTQHQAYGSLQPDQFSSILQDLEQLSSAHNALEKAMSDLTSKTDNLQVQESKLVDQIKTTSDTLDRCSTQQFPDWR